MLLEIVFIGITILNNCFLDPKRNKRHNAIYSGFEPILPINEPAGMLDFAEDDEHDAVDS